MKAPLLMNKSPFKLGYEAAENGETKEHCPFMPQCFERAGWVHGWNHYHDQFEDSELPQAARRMWA